MEIFKGFKGFFHKYELKRYHQADRWWSNIYISLSPPPFSTFRSTFVGVTVPMPCSVNDLLFNFRQTSYISPRYTKQLPSLPGSKCHLGGFRLRKCSHWLVYRWSRPFFVLRRASSEFWVRGHRPDRLGFYFTHVRRFVLVRNFVEISNFHSSTSRWQSRSFVSTDVPLAIPRHSNTLVCMNCLLAFKKQHSVTPPPVDLQAPLRPHELLLSR